MNIQLSEHFTYKKLGSFVFPSVMMMIFTSIYGVVDGLFVSNFVGKTPFAAINLIMPFLMMFGCIGFMIGTGGSAVVSMTLGMGKREQANQYFSMLVWLTLGAGIVLAVLGVLLVRPVSAMLGARGEMLEDCVLYGRMIMPVLGAFMLQNVFQSFLVTAERPHLGLFMTVAAGLTNIGLDALFIVGFRWGLAGAALATALSQIVGGVIPLVYFLRPNSSLLRLTGWRMDWGVLFKTCTNGSSELMSNVSMSLVNMLYNIQLMRFAGEDGVAAYGVIMYVNFIFAAAFLGYSIGSAPIIGYHYGAGNHGELKNLFGKSLRIVTISGLVLAGTAVLLSGVLARLFVGYDAGLMELTKHGFRLFSISFIFVGINMFGSSFFTALSNGPISALISFLRTLVFETSAVLLLPELLGLDGIWLAIVVAEVLAMVVTGFCFWRMGPRYHYLKGYSSDGGISDAS